MENRRVIKMFVLKDETKTNRKMMQVTRLHYQECPSTLQTMEVVPLVDWFPLLFVDIKAEYLIISDERTTKHIQPIA